MTLTSTQPNQSVRKSVRRGRDAKDPWLDGYEARQALHSRTANPYCTPELRELWDQGWLDAHQEMHPPR
jgi:ribosome modulation factor